MSSGTEWTMQSIQKIIDKLKHKPGAMLPILHAIQDEVGYERLFVIMQLH